MPRRVNCILPLVTVSKTHTHTRPLYRSTLLLYGREGWRNHFSTPLILHCDSRVHRSHERASKAELGNEMWFRPRRSRHARADSRCRMDACVSTGGMTGWLSNEETSDTEILLPRLLLPPPSPPAPPPLSLSSPLMFTLGDWDVTFFILCDTKGCRFLVTFGGKLGNRVFKLSWNIPVPYDFRNEPTYDSWKGSSWQTLYIQWQFWCMLSCLHDVTWCQDKIVQKQVLWTCENIHHAWSRPHMYCCVWWWWCHLIKTTAITNQFHQWMEGLSRVLNRWWILVQKNQVSFQH